MKKIPFNKLYSWIYSSFDITQDTNALLNFKKDKVKNAIIIKRSWIFGLFASWILIATSFVSFFNIYNVYKSFVVNDYTIIGYILILLLVISLYLLLQSSLVFLYKFKSTYGKGNHIEPIEDIIKELSQGDNLFINFFNQITSNIILFALIILFYIGFFVYKILAGIDTGFSFYLYTIFDIGLLVLQIYLMRMYRKKMIDLEMDYSIVIPGKIYFVNQSNFFGTSQSLGAEKIKTVNTKTSNTFMSFFNLGDVVILTEGDQGGNGQMNMFYVDAPTDTVKQIEKLMIEEKFKLSNNYLKDILFQLKISEDEFDTEETKVIVKDFFYKHEELIKEDYNDGNLITKKEIQEIAELYLK